MGEFSKRISWFVNRVKCMTLLDIPYRLKWRLMLDLYYRSRKGKDKVRYYKLNLSKEDVIKDFLLSKRGNFFFENINQKEVYKDYKKYFNLNNLIKKADNYCKHIWDLYELKRVNFGKEIEWHKDYKTDKYWPRIFAGDIYYHTSKKVGGVKYVWELNRYLHLYSLGRAYYLTKNEKYAKEILEQIESWIKQNPYMVGINWFSPLEIAIRVIAWIWALRFIKNSEAIRNVDLSKILRYIYLQTDFIYKNLSKYSSADNHLIGEATALFFVGNIYPFLKNSAKWKRIGYRILKEEIKKQIYLDGTGKEQTLNYLAFIIDFYLQAFVIAIDNFPVEVKERLKKSFEFIMNLIGRKENVSLFGDSDDATVTALSEDDNFRSLLTSAAILFNRTDFKFFGKEFDEKNFWLFGFDGIKKYKKIPNKKFKLRSRVFKEGGYAVFRNSNCRVIFDFGQLGYMKPAGHGHADALSFTLSVDGEDFIVDPGTYLYHEGGEWRDYFRSTSAHNTVKVDGMDQSEMIGPFLWGHKARTFLKDFKLAKEKDSITAYHDGFSRFRKRIFHERTLISEKKKKCIIINDRIIAEGNHDVEIFHQLHPKVKVMKQTGNTFKLKNGKKEIKITFDKKLVVEKISAQLDPILGWYSSSYGKKEPTITLRAVNKNKRDKDFLTKILL